MNDALRSALERSPRLYLSLLRWKRRRHWSVKWIVTPQSDFCIEGYPRSANSFAHSSFLRSQDQPELLRSATHTHSPAQIIRAVQWKIPTLVCVRSPKDAVCGIMAFSRELAIRSGATISPPTIKEVMHTAMRWATFHRRIMPYSDGFLVANFERIVSEYDLVTAEFIERFQLNLRPYDPSRLSAEEVFQRSSHIGPNDQRESIKRTVRSLIETEAALSVWQECDELYFKLTKL